MADIASVVDSRFKDLEASANELQKLLSKQRDKDRPEQPLFALGPDYRTPEEKESDRLAQQRPLASVQ